MARRKGKREDGVVQWEHGKVEGEGYAFPKA